VIDKSEHARQIRALVETQRYAVLSTRQDDGHPYASLVAFWVDRDLKRLVFCTLRSTRKFANLEAEGRVALLIDNRSNDEVDLQQAAAVTVLGACVEAQGDERTTLSERFLARHPAMAEFVRSPGCAVMKVDVHSHYLVTRFQNVIELHVQDGERRDSDETTA
jgi:nitroimidazol reductase NimA-like FMN-containing flavoprotein (pyridoxamine 5'-phosphate oxidase superfamily)